MKDFEHYLQDIHARTYNGLDDEMSDAFSEWLCDLDVEDLIKYANEWGNPAMPDSCPKSPNGEHRWVCGGYLEEEKVAHCLLKARQEWVMQQGAKESVVLCEMQAKAICQRFRRGGK